MTAEVFFNHTPTLEIRADFNNFKNGLISRLNQKYEDTEERELAIVQIGHANIDQAMHVNIFCNKILPIMWNASPPQNEFDYCRISQTIVVHITCETKCNKELKVKSYFYGSSQGKSIKGGFLQSEINLLNELSLTDVVKIVAKREVLEESNINLTFNDDLTGKLNLYNVDIDCKYNIRENVMDKYGDFKHHVDIILSCSNYELLKSIIYNNMYQHKLFMEQTGEISGINI